ncbi:MAG: hypothetical protein HY057_04785 [Rhodospirillales bacterium]|nr:hypothetical protein [Rhodospirillales bacterium]
MVKAIMQSDFTEYHRLLDEQMALGKFTPIMTHSFEEQAELIVFHAQLLTDFNTVHGLGNKFLQELGH